MRITIVVLVLSSFVFAQRPEQMKAAEEKAQHTLESMREQDRSAAMLNSGTNSPATRVTPKPRFSPKPGTFQGSIPPVAITVRAKDAVIYFTADGSTPTSMSQRYTGPISISATTTLKAIAIAPSLAQSRTSTGKYIVK